MQDAENATCGDFSKSCVCWTLEKYKYWQRGLPKRTLFLHKEDTEAGANEFVFKKSKIPHCFFFFCCGLEAIVMHVCKEFFCLLVSSSTRGCGCLRN